MVDEEPLETLLAMGVRPVLYGFTNHYGIAVTPWMQAAGIDEIEQFDNQDWAPDIELIASAAPDLILDSWTEPEVYERLTGVAPTIVLRVDDASTWEQVQRLVGQAVGMEDEAERAIAETEAVFPEQIERLKDYADRRVTIAYRFFDEILINGAETPIGRIVARLGLTVDAPDPAAISSLSIERWNEVDDADILLAPQFFLEDLDVQETGPLFRRLPAVQDGRYVVLPVEVARAGYIETTLSVRWVVSRIADAIIEAAEGRGKRLA